MPFEVWTGVWHTADRPLRTKVSRTSGDDAASDLLLDGFKLWGEASALRLSRKTVSFFHFMHLGAELMLTCLISCLPPSRLNIHVRV